MPIVLAVTGPRFKIAPIGAGSSPQDNIPTPARGGCYYGASASRSHAFRELIHYVRLITCVNQTFQPDRGELHGPVSVVGLNHTHAYVFFNEENYVE